MVAKLGKISARKPVKAKPSPIKSKKAVVKPSKVKPKPSAATSTPKPSSAVSEPKKRGRTEEPSLSVPAKKPDTRATRKRKAVKKVDETSVRKTSSNERKVEKTKGRGKKDKSPPKNEKTSHETTSEAAQGKIATLQTERTLGKKIGGKVVRVEKNNKSRTGKETKRKSTGITVEGDTEDDTFATQEDFLKLFADDGGESGSEGEADAVEKEEPIPAEKMMDQKTKKALQQKVKKLPYKDDAEYTPGVMYIGHIPHGFYEDQMRGFFSQFGDINHLRLSRSQKTGRSRGYAFIEFKSHEVAEIVAETMNNYLLYGRLLVCKVVPPEKVHPLVFKHADRKPRLINWKKREIEKRNKPRTPEQDEKKVKILLMKESKKRKELDRLGVSYDFPGYAACVPPAPKHQRFDKDE
mmetsp:Transcript_39857/g.64638  ORF Transcript_39857/g.64638 Transcript_39857/m.64638 type:complete len:409 (+) Transcript_39857:85-1311(+)